MEASPREELSKDQLERSRDLVLANVRDLVGALLYYDRKDDEDLPRGRIEQLIESGILTREEIVEAFRQELFSDVR